MWQPQIYLFVNFFALTLTFKNESKEILHIFIENLKQDPLLLEDYNVTQKSKSFINNKVEKFLDLFSQSHNVQRTKRSLDEANNKNSISISPKNILSIKNSNDIRLFYQENRWFAVSLENKTNLVIYKYKNESFNKLLHYKIQYTSNLAVLPLNEFTLIVVGENDGFKVMQFNFKKETVKTIQKIKITRSNHVVIWEQNEMPYLSITETLYNNIQCNIKIYKWFGMHFDHVQDISLVNIKKTVPFNIHGSNFLAAVKYDNNNQQGESKSFSEIFKFNIHSMKFELFQRLLTNGCTDIKYFTSKLYGENDHFLVVVQSVNNETSVIYKYEDNYFLPFQTLTTNAIEWQPIQDLKGDTALIAVTKNDLKGFQYNQWHFFETKIISMNDTRLNFEELNTIHTYNFKEEQILVVSCELCQNPTNIFKVNFTNFDTLKEQYSQISTWCNNMLEEIEVPDTIVAEALRGDLNEQISVEEDERRQIFAALSQSNETLLKIEDDFKYFLPLDEEFIDFEEDFEAEKLIFNNSATFNFLKTTSINDINADNLLNNILNIEEGFSIEDPIEFQIITIKNLLKPEVIINKVPLKHYVNLNDDTTIENLTINGSVTFKQNFNVKKLNNIKISNKTLLLKRGHQIFEGNLSILDLTAGNLNFSPSKTQITHLKTLKVKDLVIKGYLNRVSIPVLAKKALKKTGNQNLEKLFTCNTIEVDSLNVKGLISGKRVPDDFVLINSGEYTVNQDVEFLKSFKTNKLEVLHSLNNISVTDDGGLDILLTDSPYVQCIPTRKTFENLIIENPINLRYKIKNPKMEKYNPVIIDNNTYKINEDVTINGRSEVIKWLKADDLIAKNSNKSFGDVLEKGLKLTDKQIPVHLNFTQPLNLDDVIADKVNFLNPMEWLQESSNFTQIFKGHKTFLGDLNLNRQVNAFKINDVDVHALKREALRFVGDQEIHGVWMVDRVVAKKGILKNETNSNPNTMFVINKSLTLDNLNTTDLEIKGSINNLNMSNILRNLVKKDTIHKVFGEKRFKELHVADLIINNEDVLKLLNDVLVDELSLNASLNLPNDIKINNLVFDRSINNLLKEDFEELMKLTLNADDTVIVKSDMDYNEITVFGDVFIKDNAINGKNLSEIKEKSVKVDEDYEFENAIIDGTTYVNKLLNLNGNIENLDLDSIVEQNGKELLNIENKIFEDHLFINETLSINKNVNEMDLKNFCTFSEPNKLKTLKIKGNVIFNKDPKVLNINGENLKYLMENVWLSDKATNISGSMHLKNVTFNKSLNVSGSVDSVNLNLSEIYYLSKSKDQNISNFIAFDNITFSTISTPTLYITKNLINGILIDGVLKTFLIQGEPQIFESTAYFEELKVQNLAEDTDYTVNNLNLNTDVMRYDRKNIVTGQKTIKNLNVETLNLTHSVKIQKVDILDWLSNAVLTKGNIRVKGKKIFDRVTFMKGLSLRGKLNDQDFTNKNIMSIKMPQNITGKKTFLKSAQFKTMRIKGLVNDVDIEQLVENQINRNENSTIKSETIFENDVEVKNINIDFYDNINISQLLTNVTKLRNLKSFKGKFENLLNMGMEIENSLKGHATFFKYYQEIMSFTNVLDIFGLKCSGGIFRLVVFYIENNLYVFRTFEWNDKVGTFVFAGEIFESLTKPNFIQQITLGENDFLYVEQPMKDNNLYYGRLLKLLDAKTFEIVQEFRRNATISLTGFLNPAPKQPCLGFIDNTLSGINIYCHKNNYHWIQRIHLENVYKITTLETPDSVYLFAARYADSSKEPSIAVFQKSIGSSDFVEIQTIYEITVLNGMAAAFISNVPYLALSFDSQEDTVDSGWISIKRLDIPNKKFVEWQHIPLTTPQNVHFISELSFEPLLLVPSADDSAPLHIFRYDGAAGFKRILKGSSLPVSSKIKIIANGHFLAALQEEKNNGTILGAVVKGIIKK